MTILRFLVIYFILIFLIRIISGIIRLLYFRRKFHSLWQIKTRQADKARKKPGQIIDAEFEEVK